ncbi:hypothetical protein BU24DRAFT_15397 [Aaosphaeria arxii CBS 175.79]|uniref:Uncharacterized protein n=1 Tax=Aaosphaeria arxii CBS 175.79 TaxID=1450172 RepID=A0A6A5Y7Y5_9PLEO|nr:uncharacterized protein BU24DRAFT_15397 [Aaosphaeria arxii CBS 175.79]KAF2021127.1 hypothetical protein BU24DRAFT_15397 [Aaosphaeria arxii CBS 175.79]
MAPQPLWLFLLLLLLVLWNMITSYKHSGTGEFLNILRIIDCTLEYILGAWDWIGFGHIYGFFVGTLDGYPVYCSACIV